MSTATDTTCKAAGSSFPAFTVAALVLLILKLTAFPAISWWWIIGVWLFPLILALSILGVILAIGLTAIVIGGIAVGIGSLFDRR